jgi:hypothetical protein
MTDNFTRMLQLAESFFDAKNDPDQLAAFIARDLGLPLRVRPR